MPARRVEYHWSARLEAIEAAGWYAARSEIVAATFDVRLAEVERLISRYPEIGRPSFRGTRSVPLETFPYLVVYRPTEKSVVIVAVAHAARRPGYWRSRTKR